MLSISQATGAEFSILPAQNATGNWVKVVQRVPVRILIEQHEGDPVIRAGMSVDAEIDTHSEADTSSHANAEAGHPAS